MSKTWKPQLAPEQMNYCWITVNFAASDIMLHDAAGRMAAERRQSRSQFIRSLIEAELAREAAGEASDG